MENYHLQENVDYTFLTTQEAISIFADVDYALKSGRHIQKCPSQGKLFAFIKRYYDQLKSYYDNLFDIHLNSEGEGELEYFFIDFFKDRNGYYQRGNIPVENREYLAESHLIIAFLLIRMYVLEPRVEKRILIQDFKIQVLSEYEEYKPHLLRLFAKSEDTKETDYELKSIEDEIEKALKKFNELCWIMIDKNTETFEVMPSLNRLLNIFENYIINTPINYEP
ncbi:condensin complex protein MksE [Phocaeicola vulgatus]|uniref:condensin complex protein MksE n=1 Tax=Phocaeicola vulgatus TaxID=821 RepID=UPI0034A54DBF